MLTMDQFPVVEFDRRPDHIRAIRIEREQQMDDLATLMRSKKVLNVRVHKPAPDGLGGTLPKRMTWPEVDGAGHWHAVKGDWVIERENGRWESRTNEQVEARWVRCDDDSVGNHRSPG